MKRPIRKIRPSKRTGKVTRQQVSQAVKALRGLEQARKASPKTARLRRAG